MVTRWKPVPGYEDLYQVSDQGRVRRIAGGSGTHAGRILQPRDNGHGYLQVHLSRKSHVRTRTVHSVVAEVFRGPRPVGMVVNHKNGIKDDNRVVNLEYTTQSENVKHSRDVLGRWRGEASSQAKLTAAAVKQIRLLHARGGVTQRELAKRYCISEGQMSQILHRKAWVHVA